MIELSAVPSPEPFRVQRVCDRLDAHAVKEQREDPSHDGRFLRFDHERSVHAPVPKHRAVPWAALLEVLPDPPFLVLGRRPCFLLSVAGKDRKHQLALVAERMDVLLLKVHIHTEPTQFPDRLQQGDRVTGKARDRLHKHEVDLSGPAVGKQFLETGAGVFGPGLGFIRVHTHV